MKLLTFFVLILAFNVIHYSPVASEDESYSESSSESQPVEFHEGYEITATTDSMIMATKLIKDKLSWNDARKACFHQGHGAFLAYPTTKEEEKKYFEIMDKNKIKDVWIGIHDSFEGNGEFATVRGEVAKEAAAFTWFPGEPNKKKKDEVCTEYRKARGKKGLNDRQCNFKLPYMCKMIWMVPGK